METTFPLPTRWERDLRGPIPARESTRPQDAEKAILDPDAVMQEIQYGEERVKSVGRTNV